MNNLQNHAPDKSKREFKSFNYPICYITDENFVIPTAVSIKSIINHYKRNFPLEIFIIHTGISSEHKNLFKEYEQYHPNIRINFIEVNIDRLLRYKNDAISATPAGLIKFMMPRLLEGHKRILYIDGDTIIKNDITSIFNFDISDYYAAAVLDDFGIEFFKVDKTTGITNFFNSGMLYINCELFNNEELEEKLFECKEKYFKNWSMDQNTLNKIFMNKVKLIDLKYNLMLYNILVMRIGIDKLNLRHKTGYQSMDELINNSVMVHFNNKFDKPWEFYDCYMADEWYEIFKQTPFGLLPMERKSLTTKHPIDELEKKILLNHREINEILKFNYSDKNRASPEATEINEHHEPKTLNIMLTEDGYKNKLTLKCCGNSDILANNYSPKNKDNSDAMEINDLFSKYYTKKILLGPSQAYAIAQTILSYQDGCNLLVFGVGEDSQLWKMCNIKGRTIFLETSNAWIEKVRNSVPDIEIYSYYTGKNTVKDSLNNLIDYIECPQIIKDVSWDIIIVDGPEGWHPSKPGRALPIIWSSELRTSKTHIFVDDYERYLEAEFTRKYIGEVMVLRDKLRQNPYNDLAWYNPFIHT